METVKETENYTIFKKRNGRYGVRTTDKMRKWINGDEKAKILSDEGLIKLSAPAPAQEAPAEEVPAEESAE